MQGVVELVRCVPFGAVRAPRDSLLPERPAGFSPSGPSQVKAQAHPIDFLK
jgi:hypothetical protein